MPELAAVRASSVETDYRNALTRFFVEYSVLSAEAFNFNVVAYDWLNFGIRLGH